MTIDLAEYKDNLKSKIIVGELTAIIQILDFTIKFLEIYAYYAPVKDLMTHIKDSRTILEIHLNNHRNKLDDTKEEKEEMETTSKS
jgi:hypothetical protein